MNTLVDSGTAALEHYTVRLPLNTVHVLYRGPQLFCQYSNRCIPQLKR